MVMMAFGCEKIGAQKNKAIWIAKRIMGVAGLDVASKYNKIRNCSNSYNNINNHQIWAVLLILHIKLILCYSEECLYGVKLFWYSE